MRPYSVKSVYSEFDRSRLRLAPLDQRKSDLGIDVILPLEHPGEIGPVFSVIGQKIKRAAAMDASVIMMIGGHVIRSGVQRYIIDMMERGLISCIAMNGAGVIHDYEFALAGETTESVSTYIADGHFGLWQETGGINDAVAKGAGENRGLGEAVGRQIRTGDFPNRHISILAAAHRLGIPATVHVGIGYDIVHQFPNCNGGAYGETSYRDFLRFAHAMEFLENGVVMNFGSAVMAPEVFLKALSMVRNVARQQDRAIQRFATLVCDLKELPRDYAREAPKTDPGYYFRPWKTMLIRTVADGGVSYYQQMDHRTSIPQLWAASTGK